MNLLGNFGGDAGIRTLYLGEVGGAEGNVGWACVNRRSLWVPPRSPQSSTELSTMSPRREVSKIPRAFRRASGFVYVILCNETDRVKVGRSKDVGRRFKELETGSSGDLSLLGVFPARNPTSLERVLHDRWKTQRGRGEWFQCSPDITDILTRFGYTMEGGRQWSIFSDDPAPKRPPWLASA